MYPFYFLCILMFQVPSITGDTSAHFNKSLVRLDNGVQIKGSVLRSLSGKNIYAFRGIPFAEPPIGRLRFKAPIPKAFLPSTIIDASADGPPCIQYESFLKTFEGKEDCLYLNVYSTKLRTKNRKLDSGIAEDEPLAVMVYIHGGGFAFGNGGSSVYGPHALLDSDIVLVTFNYRLGPLGFLSTGDEVAPGNYGLLDQALALRWVKVNIAAFGGDEHRVTIVGESAGAVSVGYHLLSPLSTGLFHRAIAMSGSPLCSWGLQRDPKYWSKKISSDVYCPVSTSTDIINCLRNVDAEDIVRKANEYMVMRVNPMPFVPTVDGNFLLQDPRISITTGNIVNKVPYVSGITKDEGATMYAVLQSEFPDTYLTYDFINKFISYLIDDQGISEETSEMILTQYLSHDLQPDEQKLRETLINIISDGMFKIGHYEIIELLPKAGVRTYSYSFDYPAQKSIAKLFGINESLGVGHLDDLFFFFEGDLFTATSLTGRDKKMKETMHGLWINFIKYSNPTPMQTGQTWKECATGHCLIYHLNDPISVSLHNSSQVDLFQFWTVIVATKLEKEKEQKYYKDEL